MAIINRERIHNPRFYVDRGKYLNATGVTHKWKATSKIVSQATQDEYGLTENDIDALTSFNPTSPMLIQTRDKSVPIKFAIYMGLQDGETGINFIGALCHNLDNIAATIQFDFAKTNSWSDQDLSVENDGDLQLGEDVPVTPILNWGHNTLKAYKPKIGTTLIEIDYTLINLPISDSENSDGTFINSGISDGLSFCIVTIAPEGPYFTGNLTLGSIVYGNFYDMPHSPDINYTYNIKNDGIQRQKTLGGATVVNATYTKAPYWIVDLEQSKRTRPFSSHTVTDSETVQSHRTWELSFSALFDYDLMSPNRDLSYQAISNDFYSTFLRRTLGGQLPFIFEFNTKTVSTFEQTNYDMGQTYSAGMEVNAGEHYPNHFVVGRLEDSDFAFEQIAPGVFNISMTIEETW